MTTEQAQEIIRMLRKGERLLERGDHFWGEAEKDDYSMQDVYRVMASGVIRGEPIENEEHRNFEVRIEGRDLDGRATVLVLGLRDYGPCRIITIFSKRKGQKRKRK